MWNRTEIPRAQLLDYLSRADDMLLDVLQRQKAIHDRLEAIEFRLGVRPTDSKMMEAGELKTKRYTLFENRQIRDTDTHTPDTLMDLQKGRYWGLNIYNNHDKEVTVTLISGDSEDPNSAGTTGVSATISANTTEPIATDIWQPYLGVNVAYSVAPTSGHIRVTGWVQEA